MKKTVQSPTADPAPVPTRAPSGIEKSNGLARLAGTWTEEEHQRFEEAVVVTEQIDESLWR